MSTLNQAVRTFNQRRATQAALQNEQVTRERVDGLEYRAKMTERWLHSVAQEQQDLRRRNVWGRLKWLVTGR